MVLSLIINKLINLITKIKLQCQPPYAPYLHYTTTNFTNIIFFPIRQIGFKIHIKNVYFNIFSKSHFPPFFSSSTSSYTISFNNYHYHYKWNIKILVNLICFKLLTIFFSLLPSPTSLQSPFHGNTYTPKRLNFHSNRLIIPKVQPI